MPEVTYKHERKEDPKKFDKRSFRIIDIKPGIKATIGCPKGHWDSTKKRCKVGTRIQKIMKLKK